MTIHKAAVQQSLNKVSLDSDLIIVMLLADSGFVSEKNHFIRLFMLVLHQVITGEDACSFDSTAKETMDILQTFDYAANDVECHVRTLIVV